MKQILLIILGLSTLLWADFTRSGEIVTDSNTGLQWQDDAIGSTTSWQDAINYCENDLSLGGHNDWRLPNIKELTSLVDDTTYNPSISTVFENTASNYYWSSTTHANYTSNAWRVDFYNGYQYRSYKSNSNYVRCVRAGQ